MAYKALYRTYRPQTFEEVAGQKHIIKTLKNALANNKIAHAYLFCGPRGTGKTTMAKLFAKALNCDEGIGHQCNKCSNCLEIIEGSHPDVIEIDAASNNGVEQVRELIDKVNYLPIKGRYKVYIIDEVHMMTTSAFNALLKTIEEPPAHVIFILATTEPHNIIPTILSRCQRYDFSKVSDGDIEERLAIVLNKEGIKYDQDAVRAIISLADGGMRDALSILDQVLAYTGDYLNVDDILDMFALESKEEKITLIKSIVNSDVADVLQRLSDYTARGTSLTRLTSDLLNILKDILIFQTTFSDENLEVLKLEDVQPLANMIEQAKVMELISILMDTVKEFKNVNSPATLFQVALLKMMTANNVSTKPAPIKTAAEPPKRPVIEPKVEEKPAEPETSDEQMSLFDEPAPETKPVSLNGNLIVLKDTVEEDHYTIDDDKMLNIMVLSKKEIKNEMLEGWGQIKRMLTNPDLGAPANLLVDGHPLVAGQKILVVEFELSRSVEKLNALKNQEALQKLIQTVFGRQLFVYGVSRSESIRLQKKYMDLLQLNKLPKAQDTVLEFEGE